MLWQGPHGPGVADKVFAHVGWRQTSNSFRGTVAQWDVSAGAVAAGHLGQAVINLGATIDYFGVAGVIETQIGTPTDKSAGINNAYPGSGDPKIILVQTYGYHDYVFQNQTAGIAGGEGTVIPNAVGSSGNVVDAGVENSESIAAAFGFNTQATVTTFAFLPMFIKKM